MKPDMISTTANMWIWTAKLEIHCSNKWIKIDKNYNSLSPCVGRSIERNSMNLIHKPKKTQQARALDTMCSVVRRENFTILFEVWVNWKLQLFFAFRFLYVYHEVSNVDIGSARQLHFWQFLINASKWWILIYSQEPFGWSHFQLDDLVFDRMALTHSMYDDECAEQRHRYVTKQTCNIYIKI